MTKRTQEVRAVNPRESVETDLREQVITVLDQTSVPVMIIMCHFTNAYVISGLMPSYHLVSQSGLGDHSSPMEIVL